MPPPHRAVIGPRDAPQEVLAALVQRMLGYPVLLERDTARYREQEPDRWHEEPIYWVRRNS
jgi:hypothetical protein